MEEILEQLDELRGRENPLSRKLCGPPDWASMKNTDPVTRSILSSHRSSSMLQRQSDNHHQHAVDWLTACMQH